MDKQVKDILLQEVKRQNTTVELIASENFASDDVMRLCGSVFTNKYAEGYPRKRYYNGCEYMDKMEQLAIDELKKLYYCKIYDAHSYGVNDKGWLDYDMIESQARKLKPKMIIAGASAYSRQIEWDKFKLIADEVGAILLCDMAHYSGMIAGGGYRSPVQYADVVTSTTHKTLRGPRGGIILWNNDEYTKRINSAIFPGTQGGPLMNIIAAKAQAFKEANTSDFIQYIKQVKENAKVMSEVFIENGFNVLTGGTDCHMMLVDLSDKKYSGRQAADLLEENGITVNKNGIPNDPRSFVETSGIRIGTAAETTRGHGCDWFRDLTKKIISVLL